MEMQVLFGVCRLSVDDGLQLVVRSLHGVPDLRMYIVHAEYKFYLILFPSVPRDESVVYLPQSKFWFDI